MMKLILCALMLVVANQSYARSSKPLVAVEDLCNRIECPQGKVCRVVEKCGRRRRSQAKCVPCVPQGVDDVCNANYYFRAVLVGSLRALKPLHCHLNEVPNKFECPHRSDCVENPDSPGHGICCYGKVRQYGNSFLPVSNGDMYCSKCKPACRDGFACQEDVACGHLVNVCKPEEKPGLCPEYHYNEMECTNEDRHQECKHDHECHGSMKCCNMGCGGTACHYAYMYKK